MKVVGLGISREPEGKEEYIVIVENVKDFESVLRLVKDSWSRYIEVYVHAQCGCSCGNTWSDYCDILVRTITIQVDYEKKVFVNIYPLLPSSWFTADETIVKIVTRFLEDVKKALNEYKPRDELEALIKNRSIEFIDTMIGALTYFSRSSSTDSR